MKPSMKTEQDIFLLALQQGLYLAATMPHAEKYIREQTLKYQDVAISPLPIAIQQALKRFHVGLGGAYTHYIQLTELLQRFFTKYERDGKALTEYLFVLRAIIYNDAFKGLPKEIERKNPRITSSVEAIAFAKERALYPEEHWHAYTETQIALLYYFLRLLFVGKSCVAYRQNGQEMEALSAVQSLLEEEQALQQTFQAMTQFEAHTLQENETIPLRALCDPHTLDAAYVQLVRQQGMHIEQLLATTFVTQEEAQQLRALTEEAHFSALLIQTALAKLVRQTTNALQAKPVKLHAQKDVKTTPKPKAAKPTSSSKDTTKELQQLKSNLQAAEARISELDVALQQAQQKIKLVEAARTQAEGKIDVLTRERDELLAAKEPHANALSLLENMQTMMLQLQRELQTTEEEAEEQSIIEALKPLKIAVVGGHQNFHQEIQKRLPSVSLVIGPEELHFDEKKLINYDVVILAIKYCNHSLYERVFDYLKRQQQKDKCIVTSLKNVDMIAQEIYYRFIA